MPIRRQSLSNLKRVFYLITRDCNNHGLYRNILKNWFWAPRQPRDDCPKPNFQCRFGINQISKFTYGHGRWHHQRLFANPLSHFR